MTTLESKIQDAATRNNELLKALSETEHAPDGLRSQKEFIADLERQIRDTDKKLKVLNGQREWKLKEHEKYQDSHLRRFMYKATGNKDKFAQKASDGERKYFEAMQEEHNTGNIHAALTKQLHDAQAAKDELEPLAQIHETSQRELDEIYSSIFAGHTPQFPEEDQLEQRLQNMQRVYQEHRNVLEGENVARQALEKGHHHMVEAIGFINSALSCSRADMFGGGSLMDAMERSRLAKADHALMQARLMIVKANKASSEVQALPDVNINHGNVMSDVFFDNIFTDHAFHQEIKRGAGELKQAEVAMLNELQKTKQRQAAVQKELEAREAELKQARTDLQNARSGAFEKVLGGQVDGKSALKT